MHDSGIRQRPAFPGLAAIAELPRAMRNRSGDCRHPWGRGMAPRMTATGKEETPYAETTRGHKACRRPGDKPKRRLSAPARTASMAVRAVPGMPWRRVFPRAGRTGLEQTHKCALHPSWMSRIIQQGEQFQNAAATMGRGIYSSPPQCRCRTGGAPAHRNAGRDLESACGRYIFKQGQVRGRRVARARPSSEACLKPRTRKLDKIAPSMPEWSVNKVALPPAQGESC